jgi:hypothetical protein
MSERTSPAHDLALYLAEQGLGIFGANTSWSINVGIEPVAPDETITLYDTGGPAPYLVDEDLRRPTVQVRIRSHSPPAAYAKMSDVVGALILPLARVLFESRYVGVFMTSDILSIGHDENNRLRLTANFEAERHPVETSS